MKQKMDLGTFLSTYHTTTIFIRSTVNMVCFKTTFIRDTHIIPTNEAPATIMPTRCNDSVKVIV